MGVEFIVDPAVRLPWNAPVLASDGLHALQRTVNSIACFATSRHHLASISTGFVPPRHEALGQGVDPVFELCVGPEEQQGDGGRRWGGSSGGSYVKTRRDPRIRRILEDIVGAGGAKDHVDESDLMAFAEREHLPKTYVVEYIQAAAKKHGQSNTKQPTKVSVHRFRAFMEAREASLRKAFDALDADKNGFLTVDEVKAGLGAFQFSCPETRCNYRCKKEVVARILGEVQENIAQTRRPGISFDEVRNFFMLLPRNEMLVDYFVSARCPAICDIGACAVVNRDAAPEGSPWGHLLAGAAAGAVSRTATAPLETLRLQAMASPGASRAPLMQRAHSLVRKGGWKALYAGNAVNVLRSAPQKALDFFWFDMFKGLLKAKGPGAATFAAAGAAGAASATLLYPLEVVRSRLTINPGRYAGPRAALRHIAATEGTAALYRGLPASVASIIPEAAITYGLFDALKRGYTHMTGAPEAPPMPSLAFGVFSAFCGQLVAFPLETVARRMQMGSSASAQAVLADILAQGGPAALYQGIGAASLRVLPMAIASFGTYEVVRNMLSSSELPQQLQGLGRPNRKKKCQSTFQIEPI